jgi:multicomponent Na+:H+ antiporter subunit G
MIDIIIMIFATLGSVFIFLAALGIVRMPDLYMRISVTTKAASLGVGLVLLSAAIYFAEIGVTTKVLAIVLFIFLTAPIGAHLIGRAAYYIGVPLWKDSLMDNMKGKYSDDEENELSSEE